MGKKDQLFVACWCGCPTTVGRSLALNGVERNTAASSWAAGSDRELGNPPGGLLAGPDHRGPAGCPVEALGQRCCPRRRATIGRPQIAHRSNSFNRRAVSVCDPLNFNRVSASRIT